MTATSPRRPGPRRARSGGVLGAGALALALLGACGSEAPQGAGADAAPSGPPSPTARTASPEDVGEAELDVEEVTSGLTSPWGVLELDGGDLLVSERDTGQVLRVARDSGRTGVLRTLPDVRPGGEAGLLGLAMAPSGRQVLAYYTTSEDSRVVAMDFDGTTLGEPEPVLTGIPTGAGYHQGGRLVVGPDDLLYVGTGDNGVPGNAQDPDSLSGKVLRVTMDGEPAPGNTSGTAVYTSGHRNVEGLAFDDQGRLWSAEFGDASWDEVNLLRDGGNYGWPEVEGTGGGERFLDPVAVWRPADASPSGLAYADGSLWLAALRGERLWEVPLGEAQETDPAAVVVGRPVAHLAEQLGRLRTVLASQTGPLLVTTSNTDGRGEPRAGDDRVLEVG